MAVFQSRETRVNSLHASTSQKQQEKGNSGRRETHFGVLFKLDTLFALSSSSAVVTSGWRRGSGNTLNPNHDIHQLRWHGSTLTMVQVWTASWFSVASRVLPRLCSPPASHFAWPVALLGSSPSVSMVETPRLAASVSTDDAWT